MNIIAVHVIGSSKVANTNTLLISLAGVITIQVEAHIIETDRLFIAP